MNYWLMKSEPDAFSIDLLKARPRQIEPWSGVRNFQARNYLKQMQPGDLAFFYHSSCERPGIYGLMEVASAPYPDPTQFDPKSEYYDEKSRKDEPRWWLVDVHYGRHLKRPLALAELRSCEARLRGLKLLVPGSRLSVMPVAPAHWDYILKLEKTPAP